VGDLNRVIEAQAGESFDVERAEDLLLANARLAQENRALLDSHGVRAIDVMGSVGTGKTSLIAQLVERLKDRYRIAAIAGDLTTTIDADLLASHGVPVVQINTGKECHLDANLIRKALGRLDLPALDLLFIENVGNLICPAEFPLGSEVKIVVISVTEGPYMVLKHPHTFLSADIVAINKVDLAEVLQVDPGDLAKDIRAVNPTATVVKTSCSRGVGIAEVVEALGL
jgi:hydrogenase nickel incorporation protein HypB